MVSPSAIIRSRDQRVINSANFGTMPGANMDGNIFIATDEGGDIHRSDSEEADG